MAVQDTSKSLRSGNGKHHHQGVVPPEIQSFLHSYKWWYLCKRLKGGKRVLCATYYMSSVSLPIIDGRVELNSFAANTKYETCVSTDREFGSVPLSWFCCSSMD